MCQTFFQYRCYAKYAEYIKNLSPHTETVCCELNSAAYECETYSLQTKFNYYRELKEDISLYFNMLQLIGSKHVKHVENGDVAVKSD